MMMYKLVRNTAKLICIFLFHLTAKGRENVYKVGGAIFAVNHSSFTDPVVAACVSPRPLYCLARRSLLDYWLPRVICPKVNVMFFNRDVPEPGVLRQVIKLLQKGKMVLIFPEGTRSSNGELQPGKSGIGFVALKAKVPIIPAYVKGSYKAWPRNRRIFRLAKISVTIGEPIYLDTWLRKSQLEKTDYQEVADLVMVRIRQLSKK